MGSVLEIAPPRANSNGERLDRGNRALSEMIRNPSGVTVFLWICLSVIPLVWPFSLYVVLRYTTGHRAPWSVGPWPADSALGKALRYPSLVGLTVAWALGLLFLVGYPFAFYMTHRYLMGYRAGGPREGLSATPTLLATPDLDALEERLVSETANWSLQSVVRSYAASQDGHEDFEDEALLFELHGYEPDARDGRLSTVTFTRGRQKRAIRSADGPSPGAIVTPPKPAVRRSVRRTLVARLGELEQAKRAGLITSDEHRARRARILEET
jgi:hypothetical protein